MNKLKLLLPILLLALTGTLAAQDTASSELKHRAIQVSFVTPLGTNGLDSWSVINHFSLNILTGYAGGVRGAEFTGLVSVLKEELKGAQFAGLGNLVLGTTDGAQFSGLFNIGIKTTRAWQFAGFTNIVADTMTGTQFAGFANIASGAARGLQVSGFGNYAHGSAVTQITGFSNVTVGNNKGLQLAGFSNVHSRNMNGAQIAGATNITTGHLKGTQISGLFNYARNLKGIQIAPFNYVDSLEKGVPVGVLSFVRNGYIGVEFAASETMYGLFSFKTGIRKFYNILSVGAAYRSNMIIWGWGYGLGGMIPLSDKWNFSIEGLCYQMNEGEWFTNRLNLLNKLQAAASWKLSGSLTLFGGLSWNVTVSDITDEYGDPVTAHIAPYSLFDETYDNINIRMFPGITAGIRL